MTKSLVFAVFDSKLGAFLSPFTCPTQGVAVRWLHGLVKTEGHEFSQFAEDYTLFELGEFEPKDGSFVIHATPLSVVKALALRSVSNG